MAAQPLPRTQCLMTQPDWPSRCRWVKATQGVPSGATSTLAPSDPSWAMGAPRVDQLRGKGSRDLSMLGTTRQAGNSSYCHATAPHCCRQCHVTCCRRTCPPEQQKWPLPPRQGTAARLQRREASSRQAARPLGGLGPRTGGLYFSDRQAGAPRLLPASQPAAGDRTLLDVLRTLYNRQTKALRAQGIRNVRKLDMNSATAS